MRPAAGTESYHIKIKPGTTVVAGQDEVGRVAYVVVSPGSGEVTGLVIRKGRLLSRDVVIPIDAVEEATEDQVYVGLGVDQINELPEFREEDYAAPPAGWESPRAGGTGALFRLRRLLAGQDLRPARAGQTAASYGGRVLRAGQHVVCRDGEAGQLELVLLDAVTRRVLFLVVRRGRLLGRDTVVPVDWVRDISRDQIFLDVGRDQLDQLPEYLPDDQITADVLEALWYDSDLRPEDLHFVEVRTNGGVVELNGQTTTEPARAQIAAVARRVRGVLGVRNHLDAFESLEAGVHGA